MSLLTTTKEVMRRDQVWPFLIRGVPQVDISHQVVLYVEGLSVSFDGFKALNNLNLYVNHGELRCLIGANGAGKTTLMDVITGKTPCDEGTVYFGQTINLLERSEPEIAQLGIGRKFQKPTVFEAHTLFDNLELSVKANKGVWSTLVARLTPIQLHRIDEVLTVIGLQEQRYQLANQN